MSPLVPARKLGWFVKSAALGQITVKGWDRYFPMDRHEGDREHSMKGLFRNRDLAVGTAMIICSHIFRTASCGLRAQGGSAFFILAWQLFRPGRGRSSRLRAAPLLAAWATSSREPVGMDPVGGQRVDLVALLQEGLLTGTNKALPAYWGNIGDHDQRTVEAADIARVLWLTRAQIWSTLSKPKQDQVANCFSKSIPS